MINSTHNESEGTLNVTSAEQGSRQESWINLVVGCILLITTIISLFTNGTVLYIFFTRPQFVLTRINSYMAVVCLLAFTMASLGYPMVVSSSFAGYWLFGETGCVYYGFLMTCCGLCTMFILSLISVDQYISVVHRKFNEQSINSFSITAISGSLLMSLVLAVGPLVGWNKYVLEGLGTTCSLDLENVEIWSRSYLVTLLFVAFFLPVSVMVFCYWKIFSKVAETRRHLFAVYRSISISALSVKRHKNMNLEGALALTIVYIVAAFLLCWSPYAITMIWSIMSTTALPPLVTSIPSLVTKIGSCFTPLIYLRRDLKMRKEVMDTFPCLRSESEKVKPNHIEIIRVSTVEVNIVQTRTKLAVVKTKCL